MIENLRLSFQGIFSHKMRSLLTMLGIIIGIAAIIAIVSTIKGTNDEIKNSLIGSGDNVVKVSLSQGGMEVNPGDTNMSYVPIINDEMLDSIKEMPKIVDAARYHKSIAYDGFISHGKNQLSSTFIIGCNNDYINLESYEVRSGRLFTENDFKQFRKVVILDSSTAYTIFEGEDPIGKTIEISGDPFVVVGLVDKAEDDNSVVINGIDDWYTYYGDSSTGMLFIPDSIWPVVYSYDQPYQLIIKATSTEDMSQAGKDAQDYLNSFITSNNRKTGMAGQEGMSDDESAEGDTVKYKSEDMYEKAKDLQRLKNSTNKQLIWIASISLLVGGIGVMNIMLVSVTERTREIGLKKAIGARKSAILSQFLTEASVLTSIGGILGVLSGIGLAYFISKLAEVPVAISVPAIVLSVIFSMVIGIVFGLIPSIKAANLNPIDALRYE
ncbi:MAG: ABC transporter permease [Eubacterium sp.]|nr:ABC transporter permease [Eubacterium sp.]